MLEEIMTFILHFISDQKTMITIVIIFTCFVVMTRAIHKKST